MTRGATHRDDLTLDRILDTPRRRPPSTRSQLRTRCRTRRRTRPHPHRRIHPVPRSRHRHCRDSGTCRWSTCRGCSLSTSLAACRAAVKTGDVGQESGVPCSHRYRRRTGRRRRYACRVPQMSDRSVIRRTRHATTRRSANGSPAEANTSNSTDGVDRQRLLSRPQRDPQVSHLAIHKRFVVRSAHDLLRALRRRHDHDGARRRRVRTGGSAHDLLRSQRRRPPRCPRSRNASRRSAPTRSSRSGAPTRTSAPARA